MKIRCERALLPDGVRAGVAIEIGADGTITGIGASSPGSPGAPTGDERELRGLVLPGMPNLHSHAFQRAMAGTAEVASDAEHSFWGWREVMFRFVERLTPEDIAAIAAFAYLEMLEAGYTSVAEFHYLHLRPDGGAYAEPDTLAEAVREGARRAGIRQLLLPSLYQQGNFRGEPLHGGQRRFAHDVTSFLELHRRLRARDSGVLTSGVALHSLRAVPRESLVAVAAAMRDVAGNCPVHIHVAEQQREVSDCQAFSGLRPVEYLLGTGLVTARWCLVHATHVNATELRAMAGSGAVVGLCPTTEGNLGDGRFPLDEFLQYGGRFGIGTDSHVSLDPREELRWLEYTLRAWRERRVIAVDARTPNCGAFLYGMAVAGGAQAMGAGAAGLAVGAPADFVVIDVERPEFAGVTDSALLDAWIFAPRPGAIREVWVAGRQVISNGRHHAREAIAGIYRASVGRLTQESME